MAEETNASEQPRRPGRPKGSRVVSEEQIPVSIRIPASAHQRFTRIAHQHFDGKLAEAIRVKLGIKRRW